MNAIIFAAGLGTRLKPLTDTMPKAMVTVNGKPLLQIQLEKLKNIGVGQIVINVHHFADQIINFLADNYNFGMNISISDESTKLLDTGGGLKMAATMFTTSEPILTHNVDILSNADLKRLYDIALAAPNVAATMLVSERNTQRYLLFDKTRKLVGWTNITTGEVRSPYKDLNVDDCLMYAFSGIQVFNPTVAIPYMNTWNGKFSIIDFYLSVCDKIEIRCVPDSSLRMIDVGKIDSLAKAEEFLSM